ncbi:MAG: hypothetical protein ISP45_11340 [Reyranella sp.]|jgi:hypothetical protein|nr:hypothetical protein [Reyranella sp.]
MTYRTPIFCDGARSRVLRVCANSDALPLIARRAKELGMRVTLNVTQSADGMFVGQIILERHCAADGPSA